MLQLKDMVEITLPPPPSVNHLYGMNLIKTPSGKSRYIKYIKPEGKTWLEEAGWLIKSQVKLKKPIKECQIKITLYTIRMDLDNILKGLLDCLSHNRIIENDRYVEELHLKKVKVKKKEEEKVEVKVISY